MKPTPLIECHKQAGAQLVDFAGWALPLRYPKGTLTEYWAARGEDRAALFDVSHMGRIWIEGKDALPFVQQLTTNDASRLAPGQVQYSAMLNEAGGFIDDLTVHRLDERAFFFCVNAANRDKVLAAMHERAGAFDVRIEDRTEQTALLALQGPRAEAMLGPVLDAALSKLGYYRFVEARWQDAPLLIARTGYTGEDGFEVYLPAKKAPLLWDALLAAGAVPAGLACRDLLRTEMGYALYGHEIDAETTPLEAGLDWIVAWDKGEFTGKAALLAQKAQGVRQRLIGLVLPQRTPPPRAGYAVLDSSRTTIGRITSGAFSPKLGRGVALARVLAEHAGQQQLFVAVRARQLPAEIKRPPFVAPRVRRSSKGVSQ